MEVPVVHGGRTILCYGPSLKFGVCICICIWATETDSDPIPTLVPRLRHPPIHWSMLHSLCSMCSTTPEAIPPMPRLEEWLRILGGRGSDMYESS